MTKKIFRSIFLVALAVFTASVVIIMTALYDYFSTVQQKQMDAELTLAAEAVETEGLTYLNGFELEGIRLTWINADGSVRYDSQKPAESMENHSEREEVKEAIASGKGSSTRYSSTLTEKTLYRALRLSDGTVLRISTSYYSVPTLLFGMLRPIIIVFIVALILSFILASAVSKRVVKPLAELDFDKPLENDTYEELAPVLSHMEQQRRKIQAQYRELQVRKDEFNTVTGNLREGLVLLNAKDEILSINAAACKFVGAADDCTGKDFLTVERNYETEKAVKQAWTDGKAEWQTERDGRIYQLNISRVDTKDGPHGVAILIIDVTDKDLAEQSRREFTANVSHELKTPLQSIMGSAELIENGLAKSEDIVSFAEKIRMEADRLVTLINDIIRLSQLDEKTEMAEETVALLDLAKEEILTLDPVAAKKNIRITIGGENVPVIGVRQLCHEIIYNLCDNAIKYNKEGGTVAVTVTGDNENAVLTVADTGRGIPPEHLPRIFERFYRVDKSHSKASGGTGLGLSIVKHAACYLHAKVDVQSVVGKGTTFTVTFPRDTSED